MKRSAMPLSTKPMKRGGFNSIKVTAVPGILRTATPKPSKPTLAAKPRMRKCAICPVKFVPRGIGHKTCCPDCALAYVRQQNAKAARKADAAQRLAIKPRRKWILETEKSCNDYIRTRDAEDPCISCGRYHEGQYHAGHYKSVGAHPELRFEELNIHKQCYPCNVEKSGNIGAYRIRLIAKIGQEAVDWLEGDHPPRKHTIDELISIKAGYKARYKALKEVK